MSVTDWKEWVNAPPSENEGVYIKAVFSLPHYYLYFGFSRPIIAIGIYDGFFVPPPSWLPDWETPQWKFLQRRFSRRTDCKGLNLPSFLFLLSTFLTYIHEVFRLADQPSGGEEFVQAIQTWMIFSGRFLSFPTLPKRGDGGD